MPLLEVRFEVLDVPLLEVRFELLELVPVFELLPPYGCLLVPED